MFKKRIHTPHNRVVVFILAATCVRNKLTTINNTMSWQILGHFGCANVVSDRVYGVAWRQRTSPYEVPDYFVDFSRLLTCLQGT